jgi:hypothetical protein
MIAYSAPGTWSRGYSYCEDIIGNYPNDNYFYVERLSDTGGAMSGRDPFHVYTYDNMKCAFAHASHLALGTPPSDTVAATMAAARTNPSRPVVSLPVFIEQLKETPLRIRDNGRKKSIHSESGGLVGANFGWGPLFQDVFRIFNFASEVNDRMKELKALHSKKGLHRKWTVWDDRTQLVQSNVTVFSLVGNLVVDYHIVTNGKKWATVHWTPNVPESIPSADDLLQTARLAVHGWRISPSDVWEIIPWSWLADYFGNIGDFLQANDNNAGASPSSCCVMTQMTTSTTTTVVAQSSWISYVPLNGIFVTKQRFPSGLGIEATLPFLSARQVLNLSSLIQEHGKRH